MASTSLELVPSHNERAARTFPLSLGRVELAKWWWNSCACAKHVKITRRPCPRCKQLVENTKLLSKKLLYVTHDASLAVCASSHNTDLLWYNGQPMVKSSDSTAILLQSGDSISIGRSSTSPWMEFLVRRRPLNPVTPESDDDKNANILKRTTATPKSKRRLYYDSPSSGSFVSREQLSFEDDSSKDALYCTQNMSAADRESDQDEKQVAPSETRTKTTPRRKRQRKVAMSPRRLLDVEGKQTAAPGSVARVDNNSETMSKGRKRSRPDDCQEAPESLESGRSQGTDSRQSKKFRKEVENSRMSIDSQPTVRSRKESSQQSEESSFVSLPKCPTWNDDEQEDESGSQLVRHDQSSLKNQQGIFRKSGESQDSVDDTISKQQQDDSPDIQFASALSLSQWKTMQQSDTGRVCQALSGLVVTKRARGDSAWLPALLEGAVIDDEKGGVDTRISS